MQYFFIYRKLLITFLLWHKKCKEEYNNDKNAKSCHFLLLLSHLSASSVAKSQFSICLKNELFYRSSKLFITSVKFRGRRRMGSELVLQPRRNGSDRCGQIDVHDSVAESVRQDLTDRVKGSLNASGFRSWARMNYDGVYCPNCDNMNL